MLLSAQCHLGSKNLQVHMEPYLWKTRPDGINVINIGKTWFALLWSLTLTLLADSSFLGRRLSSLLGSSQQSTTPPIFV